MQQTYQQHSLGDQRHEHAQWQRPNCTRPMRVALSEQLFGRFNDLPSTVVAAELAGPVHHFRVPAVVALHQLWGLQTVIVTGAALARARFRVAALWNSHDVSVR